MTEFPASLPDGITLSGNGVDLRISTQLPVGNTALNHFARRVDNNTIETGSTPLWGLASPRYGFLAVADHRSDVDELITLIHEFGHLIGALDHYGINGWTTEYFNDEQIANAEFHRNCLFGEEHESMRELTDLVICPGCQELIHDKIYSICQGDQEGSGDDDYNELT